MLIDEVLGNILKAFQETSWLELAAVAFGVIQVFLSKANKISNYYFGILSILLTISVYFGARLYAEILLNLYYLVMSIYGIWYWKFKNRDEMPITTCDKREWSIVLSIIVGGYIILYLLLVRYTNSDVPEWDALVSCFAWSGMWLLAKRKLENWILLNISNAIAIPLLIHKELYLFACLTTVLFIVAIFGFFQWRSIKASTEKK